MDAPLGGSQETALDAIKNGDPIAIGCVMSDGVPRFIGRSRNTPPTTRNVRLAKNTLPQSFETARH